MIAVRQFLRVLRVLCSWAYANLYSSWFGYASRLSRRPLWRTRLYRLEHPVCIKHGTCNIVPGPQGATRVEEEPRRRSKPVPACSSRKINPRPGSGPEDIHSWTLQMESKPAWIASDLLGPAPSWIPLLLDRVFHRTPLDLLHLPTGPCSTHLDEATEFCQGLHTIRRKRSVISIASLIIPAIWTLCNEDFIIGMFVAHIDDM